jgi:hypothetical protein
MAREYLFIEKWDVDAPIEAVTLDMSSDIVHTRRE